MNRKTERLGKTDRDKDRQIKKDMPETDSERKTGQDRQTDREQINKVKYRSESLKK